MPPPSCYEKIFKENKTVSSNRVGVKDTICSFKHLYFHTFVLSHICICILRGSNDCGAKKSRQSGNMFLSQVVDHQACQSKFTYLCCIYFNLFVNYQLKGRRNFFLRLGGEGAGARRSVVCLFINIYLYLFLPQTMLTRKFFPWILVFTISAVKLCSRFLPTCIFNKGQKW